MAHQCAFCKDPVPAFNKPVKTHLAIGMDAEGHIHTHGDLGDKQSMQEMVDSAVTAIGLTSKIVGAPPKEVIFRNRQRIGDILMFTCGVRDFKKAFPKTRVNVLSTATHIWDHNPNVDRTLLEYYSPKIREGLKAYNEGVSLRNKTNPPEKKEKTKSLPDFITPQDFFSGDTNVLNVGPSRGTNQSNRIDWHFANAFRISIEDVLKVQIPQGESRPDIYFTEEEYHSPRPIEKPYWVMCITGEKSWGCKMYPFERWQKVVDQNPELTFVQIGAAEDNAPRLQGPNVLDWVGKTQDKLTGIRDLFKLFLHAEGSIGLVSFHMHLSGALYKPAVVVAGAREPVSFTRFPYHQYLATDGTLPCSVPACWHCGIDKCTNIVEYADKLEKKVPKCVDMIAPEEVSQAIQRYYVGGRLKLGVPCDKPKLKKENIVKATPAVVAAPAPTAVKKPEGLDWGKGAIDPLDWPFIEEVLRKHQVRTVLEFGAGLSTSLFLKFRHADGSQIAFASYETEKDWIGKVKDVCGVEPFYWNGREMDKQLQDFDLAFIDGPANGQNREQATRLAANHAKIVIMHDATREFEAKWEEKYLKPGFQGPIKGGRWCHMWIKTASFVPFAAPPSPTPNPKAKHIRIVSTARGWGGCARSVTTIMKMLLKEGHHVEFVPFRNEVTSREWIDALKNGLSPVDVKYSYDAIRGDCDTLLVYADDFVWEFPKCEGIFSDLGAKRKIMMLNYRRGGVGEIPWTKGWDRYLFLNKSQERDLLALLPGVSTAVYPPCADLAPFFEAKPVYDGPLRIVRHSSQGDTKFDKENEGSLIQRALDSRPELTIDMLPGPSFVQANDRFKKHQRTGMPGMLRQFLEKGNLFWYSLPKGYIDAGPRVIIEAMAAGLPVIADNCGGAPDRVTPDCGWICNSKEGMLEVIKNVTPEELKRKGQAARERAMHEFRPERWITELTEEPCTAAIQ